ncbi:hypothetical protein Tco_0388916 [Tanacetum coccineum]
MMTITTISIHRRGEPCCFRKRKGQLIVEITRAFQRQITEQKFRLPESQPMEFDGGRRAPRYYDHPKEIPKEAGTSHQNLKVAIHPNFPDQEVAIGGTLSLAGHTELCTLLKKNLDIFAWQPSDMTGVPRSIAEHRLNIRKDTHLSDIRKGQPRTAKAIPNSEMLQNTRAQESLRSGITHDYGCLTSHGEKHDSSWRMLVVDFHRLNKHVPQGLLQENHTRKGGDDRGRRGWTDMDDPDNKYLKDGTLPGDRKEASKLRIKARQYELIEGTLYRRSFLKPWLRSNRLGKRQTEVWGEGNKARPVRRKQELTKKEELPHVPLAHPARTIKNPTMDSPFFPDLQKGKPHTPALKLNDPT